MGEATERVSAAKALERIWDAVVWDSTPNADKPGLLAAHAALVAHILAASDSSTLLARLERAEAENERLKQAYWEARAIMGFDNHGDPTPAALVYPAIADLMKRDAEEMRRDYDAALRQDAPGGGA